MGTKKMAESKIKLPGYVPIRQTVRLTTDEKAPFQERLREAEQSGLTGMNGGRILIEEALPKLEKRLKKLGLWSMMKGVEGMLRRAHMALELSADPEQIQTLTVRAQHQTAHVGYTRINHDPDATYVLTRDLDTMAEAIFSGTCNFCVKKGEEAIKCPLQKALRSCTIADDTNVIEGCMFRPYSDAAYYGLLDDEKEDLAL